MCNKPLLLSRLSADPLGVSEGTFPLLLSSSTHYLLYRCDRGITCLTPFSLSGCKAAKFRCELYQVAYFYRRHCQAFMVRPLARPSARSTVRPPARPSARPTVRPRDRPSARATVRPLDRPSIRPSVQNSTFQNLE